MAGVRDMGEVSTRRPANKLDGAAANDVNLAKRLRARRCQRTIEWRYDATFSCRPKREAHRGIDYRRRRA